MAPRPFWKGYLRLSLVLCPIRLFPATSEREKIRFHQINKKTEHRIKYCKLDAQTGEQVDPEDIGRGAHWPRALEDSENKSSGN
jgi:DNA end-binding protein Ku